MRLINHIIIRVSLIFTVVMLLWSGLYLWLQMKEIYDGIDEGLINLKQEFVMKANIDHDFAENMLQEQPINLQLKEISFAEAENAMEHFHTAKVYFTSELEEEEVRMFTSAFYCSLNGKYYQIQFFTSTVETNDMVESILWLTLALWIMLTVTLIAVSKFIISRSNKPFYALLDELKRFRLDKSRHITVPATGILEYIQLNETVEELIFKNINIFNEQKEFIENCSHEIQTPLTVAIARLELLTEKYQQNETYIQELGELSSILGRMKRLNTSLLFLSKIKNNQFPAVQRMNLCDELQNVLDELSDFTEYKEIEITFDNKKTVEAEMNSDLAHILLINLIKNAITHNVQGGKIRIEAVQNRLTIANTGSRPLEHVFTRYRSSNQNAKFSGIGLSIVKSIADLYKIKIEYRFEDNSHVFILNFSA